MYGYNALQIKTTAGLFMGLRNNVEFLRKQF